MENAITIQSQLSAYCAGTLTPGGVIERFLAQPSLDKECIWISRTPAEELRAAGAAADAALAQDAGAAICIRPLLGVLFAVKDNIDVAGVATTAACPGFARTPKRSAGVVERLLAAGAVCVGKTNLDQFATGLVGTRSPYGAVANAFSPAHISGGSSSGSAGAVARGWVSFALGTDTAGSGRVPAGLNNIVGLKPSRGLLSVRGVLPACASLDCVSIFTLTSDDAATVFAVARGPDHEDPYSRAARLPLAPDSMPPGRFVAAVPARAQREFFGDVAYEAAFEGALATLTTLGAQVVEVNFAPLLAAAALLYGGPWVAERTSALRSFYSSAAAEGDIAGVNPIVRGIVEGGAKFSAADAFDAIAELQRLRLQVDRMLWEAGVNVLVVPTAPTVPTAAAVAAAPVAANSQLGYVVTLS
jgi:allophanate hydrolase